MPPPLEGVAEEAPKEQEEQSQEESRAAEKGKRPKVQ